MTSMSNADPAGPPSLLVPGVKPKGPHASRMLRRNGRVFGYVSAMYWDR
ncbi:hypothetical protein [Microbacterium sp. ProA8]